MESYNRLNNTVSSVQVRVLIIFLKIYFKNSFFMDWHHRFFNSVLSIDWLAVNLNNTLRLLQTQLLFHYLCSLRPKPSASYHINPWPHTIKSELFWSKDLRSVTQNAWLRNWQAPRSSADWSPVVYIYLWTVWKRHFYFTLLKTIGNVGSVPKSYNADGYSS